MTIVALLHFIYSNVKGQTPKIGNLPMSTLFIFSQRRSFFKIRFEEFDGFGIMSQQAKLQNLYRFALLATTLFTLQSLLNFYDFFLITCQISSPKNPHARYNSLGFVGLSTFPDTVTNSALSFIQNNSFTTNLPSPFPLYSGET